MLGVIILVATTGGSDSDEDLGGLRPESAIAKQCPVTFNSKNESVLIAGCKTDACGGFIEWCGLGSANYSLSLSLAGDYDNNPEFMELSFGDINVTVTTGKKCDKPVEVFVASAMPVGGVLRLTYANSAEVGNICNDDYANAMRAVLKPVS